MNNQEFLIRLAKIEQEAAQVKVQKLNVLLNELSGAHPVEPDDEMHHEPARPQPRPANVQADGQFVDFPADVLSVGYDDTGKVALKVKGGAYRKFGVRIWPECLLAQFNIDAETLQPGMYDFKHHVRALVEEGRPKKIIGLAPTN